MRGPNLFLDPGAISPRYAAAATFWQISCCL